MEDKYEKHKVDFNGKIRKKKNMTEEFHFVIKLKLIIFEEFLSKNCTTSKVAVCAFIFCCVVPISILTYGMKFNLYLILLTKENLDIYLNLSLNLRH